MGHIALSKCNQDPGLGGQGLAKVALIVGYSFFALVIICVLYPKLYALGDDTLSLHPGLYALNGASRFG